MGFFGWLFGDQPEGRWLERQREKRRVQERRRQRETAASIRERRAAERRAERQRAHEQRMAQQEERARERREREERQRREREARASGAATAKARRAHGGGGSTTDLAARFARTHGGSAEQWDGILRRSGVLRNPSPRLAVALAHLHGVARRPNPDPRAAAAASATFHGEPGEVRGGRVVLGTLEAVEYRPPARSRRGGAVWRHEMGDRGLGKLLEAKERPLLVADPRTGRVQIDQARSPARFEPDRGIVG